MRKVIRVDELGLFLEDVILEDSESTPMGCIEMQVPNGFYLPKWNGTEWEEGIPQEEIDANIDSLKQAMIIESKSKLDQYLLEHPFLYTDSKYYSVTKEKQNLLSNAISVYQMKVSVGEANPIIKWNATGEECTEWTIENIMNLALSIAEYVEPLVSQQQTLEVRINLCTTKSELEGIVITYETV